MRCCEYYVKNQKHFLKLTKIYGLWLNRWQKSYLQKFLHIPDLPSTIRTILHVVVDPPTACSARGRFCWLLIDDYLGTVTKEAVYQQFSYI